MTRDSTEAAALDGLHRQVDSIEDAAGGEQAASPERSEARGGADFRQHAASGPEMRARVQAGVGLGMW
jgi:hypothetical protein